MKKSVLTHVAFALALLLLSLGLFAQTPVISVNMTRNLTIPDSYNDVLMLPNGDLRFLNFTVNRTGLVSQISSIWLRAIPLRKSPSWE